MKKILTIALLLIATIGFAQTDLDGRIPLRQIYPIDTLATNINKVQWDAYINRLISGIDLSNYWTKTDFTSTDITNWNNSYAHSLVITGNPHDVIATEISDFDTEVSNNASVVANTGKDTTGIYHINRNLIDNITASDTLRWGTAGSTDHSLLSNLDYASAAHTGFAGTDVSNTFSISYAYNYAQSIYNTSGFGQGLLIETAAVGASPILTVQSTTSDLFRVNGNGTIKMQSLQLSTDNYVVTYDPTGKYIGYKAESPSYGAATQLPYMNATATGFDYSSSLTFNGTSVIVPAINTSTINTYAGTALLSLSSTSISAQKLFRFWNQSSATTTLEGTTYYDTDTKTPQTWNGTSWVDLGASSGSNVTGIVITGNQSKTLTLSQGAGGDIVALYTDLVDDADPISDNEGKLTVSAGTSTTSIINSNTSGSTPVTIEVGDGMSIAESGNTITLNSTGSPTTKRNDVLTGASAGYSVNLNASATTSFVILKVTWFLREGTTITDTGCFNAYCYYTGSTNVITIHNIDTPSTIGVTITASTLYQLTVSGISGISGNLISTVEYLY